MYGNTVSNASQSYQSSADLWKRNIVQIDTPYNLSKCQNNSLHLIYHFSYTDVVVYITALIKVNLIHWGLFNVSIGLLTLETNDDYCLKQYTCRKKKTIRLLGQIFHQSLNREFLNFKIKDFQIFKNNISR